MSNLQNPEPQVNGETTNGPPVSRKQAILSDPANKPKPPPLSPNSIPADLVVLAQWVAWRFVWKDESKKWEKLPINANNGWSAKVNNPATWSTFAQVVEFADRHHLDGVGFVFSAADPYAGIDLDDCRDPDMGLIDPWAQDVINEFNTYTEISPTGTGVKLFVRGTVGTGINTPKIEMYDRGRFFTVTGQRVPGTPDTIAEAQPHLDAMIGQLRPERAAHGTSGAVNSPPAGEPDASKTAEADYLGDVEPPPPPDAGTASMPPTDEQIIKRARNAKNGAKFCRLWEGDTSGYASASQADLALCSILAYWTRGDRAQIDRLFRRSGLYRAKWDEKHFGDGRTYGEGTLDTALAKGSDFPSSHNGKPNASANHKPSTSSASTASETLDDLTLSIVRPRRTNTGAIRAGLVITRNQQPIDEIPISNTPSNRDKAAKQIKKYLPNGDRLQIDAAITRLVTSAGRFADNPPTVEGETMHEIVLRFVARHYCPMYRTADGFYSERLGEEIPFRKFIAHVPTELVTECTDACDAPARNGGVHRGALVKAIEVELKIYYSDLIGTLDVAENADLSEKSVTAKAFRTQFAKLLTVRKTAEPPKDDTDRPRMASLMSRAAKMDVEGHRKGFNRWLRVLDGVNFWIRFHVTKNGEFQVWFGIRWEAGHQVGMLLPGVGDQDSLLALGVKFGVIDPAPPVPIKTAGGRVRLLALRRDFTQPLLEDAGDFDDGEEPAPASHADAKPKSNGERE